MLRVTTIFLFGVACFVVAPAFFSSDYPSYVAPAGMIQEHLVSSSKRKKDADFCYIVVAAGALPLIFVSYTSAPYVNFVHLALPVFARRSREQAIQYAKKLPPTATLYINTMKFTTIPRRTEVRLADLVPDRAKIRPVSFRNQNPAPPPWWQWRTQQHFYTGEKSKPGRASSTFYPELWEHVYRQIQNNQPLRRP